MTELEVEWVVLDVPSPWRCSCGCGRRLAGSVAVVATAAGPATFYGHCLVRQAQWAADGWPSARWLELPVEARVQVGRTRQAAQRRARRRSEVTYE